jgi:phosphoribosyl-ATP pyrophosphohydrolase
MVHFLRVVIIRNGMTDFIHDLFSVLQTRAKADPEKSYTARLMAKGTPKIAQKVGEEAVEVVIEALRADRVKIIEESCDLLYHLLVLWLDGGVTPTDVETVLRQRAGDKGLEDKAAAKDKRLA